MQKLYLKNDRHVISSPNCAENVVLKGTITQVYFLRKRAQYCKLTELTFLKRRTCLT